ncbi:MAG: hypothetical protein CMG00_01450 [Candidatus Marinimicrobia bacterium]|nr:hypothetical protein [Candidatus Neomarinimicrobiota bacterium]|tara:strand:- start:5706 stop:6680 length:975 start_codon:yes stop_codon:yes gene_type:complete
MIEKKRILVIGGSGFIGSYLIKRLLEDKNEIINFDKEPSSIYHENLQTVIGNVKKPKSFDSLSHKIDLVYILAAEHRDDINDSQIYYDTNYKGMKNIIKYCNRTLINNIIFYSSAAVYGNNFTNCSEEKSNLNPQNHYGKSKVLAESELSDWVGKNSARRLIIIRPSAVYGKGSKSNMNRMIDYISKGKFIMVGRGDNIKTVCYVENLVDFTLYVQSSSADSHIVFNYADFPHYSINKLIEVISKIVKKKIIKIPYVIAYGIGLFFDFISFIINKKNNMSSNRVKKFCSNTSLDTKKIEDLGYKPKYNLIDSINKSTESFINLN